MLVFDEHICCDGVISEMVVGLPFVFMHFRIYQLGIHTCTKMVYHNLKDYIKQHMHSMCIPIYRVSLRNSFKGGGIWFLGIMRWYLRPLLTSVAAYKTN